MATRGILKYGQKALGPVLSQLNNPHPEVRSSALTTGIVILKMKNDAASRLQILSMIRVALNDPEYLPRASALDAIALDDRAQFVPALRKTVRSDPAIVPGEFAENPGQEDPGEDRQSLTNVGQLSPGLRFCGNDTMRRRH